MNTVGVLAVEILR